MGTFAYEVSLGRGIVYPNPPTPAPATLAAAAVWNSGIIFCGGIPALSATAQLSQTGTLVLQRFIDEAGNIPLGAPISQPMMANTLAYVWVRDGQPAGSFQLTVTNTSGSTGNLSNVEILESV